MNNLLVFVYFLIFMNLPVRRFSQFLEPSLEHLLVLHILAISSFFADTFLMWSGFSTCLGQSCHLGPSYTPTQKLELPKYCYVHLVKYYLWIIIGHEGWYEEFRNICLNYAQINILYNGQKFLRILTSIAEARTNIL